MSGLELLQHMTATRPFLPAILMSGYSYVQLPFGLQAQLPYGYLQKPFDLPKLSSALRSQLDRQANTKS